MSNHQVPTVQPTQKFLFASGIGIILIGITYGIAPQQIMGGIVGLSLDPNALHVFRAIMGLYCGLGVFLMVGARQPSLTHAALLIETIFMGSLAAGRLLSLVVDQHAHWFLLAAMGLELGGFAVCMALLKRRV